MFIKAKQQTFLKKSTDSASTLSDNQKVVVAPDKIYEVEVKLGGLVKGHQLLKLAHAAGDWYVFAQHWDFDDDPAKPTANNNIPSQAIALIKEFEGYSSTVYNDGVGVATIGYGTTVYPNGARVRFGDRPITEAEAIIYSNNDLRNFWDTLVRTIPFWKEMTDNQRSALLSFAYNLGAHFYNSNGFSTISGSLARKNWGKIPDDFLLYVNPGSSVEAGLTRRRRREGDLWRT